MTEVSRTRPSVGANGLKLRARVGGRTDPGKVRERNEDAFAVFELASPPDDLGAAQIGLDAEAPVVSVVCDGMGGAEGGQVSSAIGVETLAAHARTPFPGANAKDPTSVAEWLSSAVEAANRAVYARSNSDPELEGMGATMTAVAVVESTLVWAHVGDSRAYHLRGGQLRQLTLDHSLVAQLVASGQISIEEARTHENRNLLTQALGSKKPLIVDVGTLPARTGDRVLICSDGLYDPVAEPELAAVLATDVPPEDQADQLVLLANSAGGGDNITAVVIHLFAPEE